MVTIIGKWSKSEIGVIIRFMHAKGNPSTEIYKKLTHFFRMKS